MSLRRKYKDIGTSTLFRKERRREIPVAGIGENNHNSLSLVLGAFCQLFRSLISSARRYAYENSFAPRNQSARTESVLVGYGDYLVVYLRVQNVGNETRSDPLYLMGTRLTR